MRIDGYAPIREYAAIGDGRTAALVASDGAIDWLCLPNFDSPSVFAAALDVPRGGSFVVQPAVPFAASRRYLPSTNVLETTFTTEAGIARLLDMMTLPDDGLCPSRELVRVVEGVSGSIPMRWRCAPRFCYGAERPAFSTLYRTAVASFGGDALAISNWGAGAADLREDGVEGTFDAKPGARALLSLAAAYAEPLVFPNRSSVDRRIDVTIAFWRRWSGAHVYEGPWHEAVTRSALALKLMIFAPSGASTAAPTTSLPEEIGGIRNWDYRFCWIRDSAFLIDALLQLGYREEAQALFWWFMQATARTEPKLQVLYRLDGGTETAERGLPLAGYRGSQPVRVGNAAAGQTQLDVYGSLLETIWLYAKGDDYRIDHDTGIVIGHIADFVCENWRRRDAGIWEVRGDLQHFTQSKVMCWVALDRALRLAEEGEVPRRHIDHWRQEADAIASFVETRCWSDRLRSYTRAADSEDLDASLLMLSLVGFGDPKRARMQGTIDALSRVLRQGTYVHRYLAEDGLPGSEGAFLNCSFWMVGALARAGRIDEATSLMNNLVALANDVGLYAEEIDRRTGEFLGNFPQALVHLSLIGAALTVAPAVGGGPPPKMGTASSGAEAR
jgi:GH15 family glucan-1,4-alpha-glucosidase